MPIVVDPYLIALPHSAGSGAGVSAGSSAEHVRQYAQRFSTWEKEFAKAANNYVVSWGAYCAIEQDGLMPTTQSLQRLFDLWAIEEYSAHDFVANCSTFLANCGYLEDLPGVADLYKEDVEQLRENESIIPEEMRQRLTPAVADAFVTSLIYTAYVLAEQQAADDWFIATAPLSSAAATDLRTASMLRRLDHSTIDVVDTQVQRDWPLLIEPDYLYASYDVVAHFEDPVTSTRVAWCKRKLSSRSAPSIDSKAYCFGAHFVDSLTSSQMRRRRNFEEDVERVYGTIIDVLQGLAFGSDKHHALRDPLWSHSAPIKTRARQKPGGGAVYDTAARAVVVGGPTPLRLHYWRCADGSYEFSNVTTEHDDGTIFY